MRGEMGQTIALVTEFWAEKILTFVFKEREKTCNSVYGRSAETGKKRVKEKLMLFIGLLPPPAPQKDSLHEAKTGV